eukprot:scaffold64244_cov66-Phaeocystis_antarctica.AAC.3
MQSGARCRAAWNGCITAHEAGESVRSCYEEAEQHCRRPHGRAPRPSRWFDALSVGASRATIHAFAAATALHVLSGR